MLPWCCHGAVQAIAKVEELRRQNATKTDIDAALKAAGLRTPEKVGRGHPASCFFQHE